MSVHQKYEYTFIRIKVDWLNRPKQDINQIIKEQGHEGWRFVQIYPMPMTHGALNYVTYYELVFEKPI
ncbi:MAG: DUF4177 domain-containing protein [Candidatus Babeliales bacterium]